MKHATLLLAALLGLSQCRKKDPDPLSQLPPATQTGANTFGCLLNGQAWTPQGNSGTSNYSVAYCCTADGGVLDIAVYRINSATQDYQHIILFSRQLNKTGAYNFTNTNQTSASINDRKNGCYLDSQDVGVFHKGQLVITRFDLQAGIIAGTFDFVLAKPGCDTVRVTKGRFDKKL
ncbi:hypothetical protein CDA63_08650 [Hymenobacter amundsenii]|uniref:Uncharacterized protein n=1 Tax=Hymenobacter amundsenii TaxID=2006685 RepID=A0A246FL19_9BACT|nr:DUF6252 family protein [Hymenobacter amundsenii]OWP63441.1 hypothetical protein CDA63_08650 [Hymenobacter amundsenii]